MNKSGCATSRASLAGPGAEVESSRGPLWWRVGWTDAEGSGSASHK